MTLSPEALLEVVALALIAALIAGGVGLLVLRLGRRWSLTAQLLVVVLAAAAGVVGGTVATTQAMYLSAHDAAVSLWIAGASAVVSLVVAGMLGRSLMRNSLQLRALARGLGEGAAPPPTVHRSSEMNALATELTTTSARLEAARHEVERMDADRRELVAWVSHDLRAPLASMRAMAEALEDGLVDEPARYHAGIRMQVERLSAMVDDLFELSKLHSGRLALETAPVPVYDLISDGIADLAPLAERRGVAVRAAGDLEASVVGDARLLSRAIGNLLGNAVQYSPAGTEVVVTAASDDSGTTIAVTDHAGGIEEADLTRVFEAGWRGQRTSVDASGAPVTGAGLGLAIVRGILEAHGGSVGVRNTGDGCRFALRVPAS